VRNAGTASASLRLRVPKPPSVFAVRLPADALVAPGMSRTVRVDVMVASSEDVREELVVLGPPDIVVALVVRRSRPELVLPEPLACGHCIVGAIKRAVAECKNIGDGHGRFLMFAQAEEEDAKALLALAGQQFGAAFETAFCKAEADAQDVVCEEFSLSPRTFTLGPGQAVKLIAVFAP
jgi:hypothetical protein